MRYAQVKVKVFTLAAGGFLAASLMVPEASYAGLFGSLSRALGGHLPGNGYHQKRQYNGNGGGGSDDSSTDDTGSDSKSSNTLAGALKDAANAAAAVAEWQEMDRAKRLEEGRNVDLALTHFVKALIKLHKDILNRDVNVAAATGLNINQVTTGELRRGAEQAYQQARLFEFERYAGELWTRDRLMVRIIQQSEPGLKPYFEGVGAKGPSMAEINDLFGRSAVEVHSKALEISEIVGVSLSFDRFIRAMYENSDRTEGLWAHGSNEQADGLYERLATTLIDSEPREKFIQDGAGLASDPLGLERQFQYRFRARRALYDCLTAHYADFVNKPGKPIEAAFADRNSSPTATGALTKGLVPEPTKPAPVPAPVAETAQPSAKPVASTNLNVASAEGDISARAQAYIEQFCRESTLSVAELARGGKIEPISTRVDASAVPVDDRGPAGGGTPAVLVPQ